MHWIVQNNLYSEAGYAALMETLERHQIPHTVVKVVPFSHELIPEIQPEGLVYVCGSTTLAKVACDRKWTPGSFINEDFHYSRWQAHLGRHLLNSHGIVTRFGEAAPPWNEFFVRPCEDTKTFSGAVMGAEEFLEWKHKVLDLHETYTTLDAQTQIVMSPVQEINREYRFFVVDGKVVTGSLYRMGRTVVSRQDIDPDVLAFAQRMVGLWEPARAFVLDVAVTPAGLRVIEINNINSAGFYACDVSKIVQAVEAMEF
jgi:hypothetical protein